MATSSLCINRKPPDGAWREPKLKVQDKIPTWSSLLAISSFTASRRVLEIQKAHTYTDWGREMRGTVEGNRKWKRTE